jgi:pimeloyl-ACP methyl ester carboxylesterase
LHVLRAAVDWRGQVVTMLDRCYLAEAMPVLVVWGGRDSLIPVGHAAAAVDAMPGARLVIFDRAGHFPHRDQPARFVDVVRDFIESTDPSAHLRGQWREILQRRYSVQ